MDQSNLARSLGFHSSLLMDARRYEIGRYGRLRLAFLREKHPDVYTTLIFTGELGPQLVEFDAACREKVPSLTEELARREGITEQLKATPHRTAARQAMPFPPSALANLLTYAR